MTFNTLCILLSIVINILMLVTWVAPASGADVDAENPNQTIIDLVKEYVISYRYSYVTKKNKLGKLEKRIELNNGDFFTPLFKYMYVWLVLEILL